MMEFLSRHAAPTIAVSAVLTGAALWALLVGELGYGHAEAALLSGLVLLSLAQLHIYRERAKGRKSVRDEIERIMASTHDLLGDVAALRDDVGEMRKRIGERNFLHADKIAAQIASLEEVIGRLDRAQEERMRGEQGLVGGIEALVGAAIARAATSAPRAAPDESRPGAEPTPRAPAAKRARGAAPDLVGRVKAAIAASRVDLYLQPIVTLPQRKVRYYEALTRLRDEEGHIIMPRDYLPAAREAGLVTEIDNLLLFRSVALVRRLIERRRDVGVFCNISAATLLDSAFFPQFIEFMEENAELAPVLVFELAEPALDAMGPLEEESLNALSALGFRFSIDHVRRLDLDFERLAGLGFRFVKLDASVMLDHGAASGARIHPEDLAKLAERHGIQLIAAKIEAEKTVVSLLDYNVRLAQGFLFARPRLLREEASAAAPFRAAA